MVDDCTAGFGEGAISEFECKGGPDLMKDILCGGTTSQDDARSLKLETMNTFRLSVSFFI